MDLGLRCESKLLPYLRPSADSTYLYKCDLHPLLEKTTWRTIMFLYLHLLKPRGYIGDANPYAALRSKKKYQKGWDLRDRSVVCFWSVIFLSKYQAVPQRLL